MGNQSSEQFKRKQKMSFDVRTFDMDMKVDLNVKFEQSSYNILDQRFKPIPMMDKTIRDSEFCYVDHPQLTSESKWQLLAYIRNNLPHTTYAPINNIWRMTKYNPGGHFLQHCDRQKQLEGYLHVGTHILIPPKSIVPHQGGELILIDEEKRQQVPADPQRWTHVIIPLGVAHQVNKVMEGFRISYVKEIWIEDQLKIQTDQDRWERQRQQIRRNEIYQEQQKKRKKQHQQWLENRWKNRKNWPPGHVD